MPVSIYLTLDDQVEGDELTGVCLLGAQTDSSLLHQVILMIILLRLLNHMRLLDIKCVIAGLGCDGIQN